jgi:predicted dehydrogenase
VAVVGIGSMPSSASVKHGKAIKQSGSKLKLVTCFTRSEDKRKRFAKENDCEFDQSYEAVLDRKDLDAIILSTPNSTHADLAIQAIESGKHVLIEKPLATSVKDCIRIIDSTKSAGVVVGVAEWWRFLERHRLMKSMIEKGELGTVLLAEGNESNISGMNLTPDKWRYHKIERELILFNSGIHPIDTLRYLLGEVEEVCGFLARRASPGELDDTACASLRFDSGALATLSGTYSSPKRVYLNVFGTEANAQSDETGLYIAKKGAATTEKVQLLEGDPILSEQNDFADAIRQRRSPRVDLNEGTADVAIVEAIIKSFEERRYVKIEEVLD